jgi:hypothetical protein
MARPDTPKLSLATTESLIWASSSSLLHPLLLGGPGRHQIGPVAGHVPQLPDHRWWHEAGPQHLPLGQLAQPDRIQGVGLGTSREVLDITGIHQPDLEPGRFQQVAEAPFQESLVASITTRVTPSSASRSARASSQRVIVW